MKGRTAVTIVAIAVFVFAIALTSGVAQQITGTAPSPQVPKELLPLAKPGQCFAKVTTPAEYKSVTEEVVVRQASTKYEIISPKYEWVNEKVLVKPASEKIVEVPAVFGKEAKKVEIEPAQQIWRVGRTLNHAVADASVIKGASALGIPATAKPGDCYTEYYEPRTYKTETEKVVVREAYDKIETVLPKYEQVTEKEIVKPASFRFEEQPAVYETVTEKVLATPAYTTWKNGRGPAERIDHASGEIMCLVEVPATYKTVTKRILKTPATTKKIEIPAKHAEMTRKKLVSPATEKRVKIPAETVDVEKRIKLSESKVKWLPEGTPGEGRATGRMMCLTETPAKHKTIYRNVLKTPTTTKKVEIPAEYKTVRMQKLVTPAQEKKIDVPAKKQNLTKQVKVADGKLEWRPVLCETNITRDLITDLQKALKTKGFNPGPIDGVLGSQTMTAVSRFQEKQGLARGGLTIRTVEALGVRIGA